MLTSSWDERSARRGRRLWRTVSVMLTIGLALLATTAIAATAGAQSEKKLLGTKNVAKGEPVKVGFVSSGRSPNLDNQYQVELAKGLTKYANEYKGGIGGRPIELHDCVSGQSNAAKAQECANQLINDGVVMIISPDYDMVSVTRQATAAAKVPLFLYSITDPAVLTDGQATFQLSDPSSRVYGLPIDVAKKNKLKLVTAAIIDVPASTTIYTSDSGKQVFADAKMGLKVVAIPPGQADVTPQMAQIAQGQPTAVQISGNDAMCIAVFKGLQANAFTGPMTTSYTCITDSTRQAVGNFLKGVYLSVAVPIGDTADEGYKQLQAIVNHYGLQTDVPDLQKAQLTYSTFLSAVQPLADMKGTINAATITSAFKAMPNMKMIGGGGLNYRCNGKANPEQPALCAIGTLTTRLDAKGYPKFPYTPLNNQPIPD